MKFAAFIITYERESILPETIKKLLAQTLPPEEILIVDNSETNKTFQFWQTLNDGRINYHNMGYNSGPAGAAYYGLKTLADKGYDWIFWGDDDDPPSNSGVFQHLLNFASQFENVGIVGMVGGRFIKNKARTRGFYNKELKLLMEADYVAGGKMMIVNANVPLNNIYPTKKLFFGFEELDFCLKVKNAGFRIIFDGQNIKQGRVNDGKTHPNYKWRGKNFGNSQLIWRNYYSVRNMLYILKIRKYWKGYFFFLIKTLLKMPVSFRFGLNYGSKFSKSNILALLHHFSNKYGFYAKEKL